MVAEGRFELPTSGLWARRATTALPRDIAMKVKTMKWRRKRDSNPRTSFPIYRFSRPDPSTTWVFLQLFFCKMVDPVGLEPTTNRLWAGSSNHWAKGPSLVAAGGLEPSTYRVWTGRSKPTGLHRQLLYKVLYNFQQKWWSLRGSNPPPPACKAGALPDELRPLFFHCLFIIQYIF